MVHMTQSVWDRFPLYYFKARHGRLPLHAELWAFYSSELRFGPKGYVSFILPIPFFPLHYLTLSVDSMFLDTRKITLDRSNDYFCSFASS